MRLNISKSELIRQIKESLQRLDTDITEGKSIPSDILKYAASECTVLGNMSEQVKYLNVEEIVLKHIGKKELCFANFQIFVFNDRIFIVMVDDLE